VSKNEGSEKSPRKRLSRRELLIQATWGAGALGAGLLGSGGFASAARAQGADDFGPLQGPDGNGLRLPMGFQSRVVGESGLEVGNTGYVWHAEPDGGATFPSGDGGWIYVSNSELGSSAGGVGAIRFAPDGSIADAYSILLGTNKNCAGGPTPWNTWLSCEEVDDGQVYECDPMTRNSQGVVRPALGVFRHEAAAVDPIHQRIYLTEDKPDGLLYRFSPTLYPDLSSGLLEVAEIVDPGLGTAISPGEVRSLAWHVVPDPSAYTQTTRTQVSSATAFDGGEGCWYRNGRLFFSTKNDHRIWEVDLEQDRIEILYDKSTSSTPTLSGPDNVFAAPNGDVYVAEDPGQLQIVALTSSGGVTPIVQVTGQTDTELTGPALSPDGTRLYFSSQRHPGTTYEVMGPYAGLGHPVPTFGWLGWMALIAGPFASLELRKRLRSG
jgi:secreted PhoX family phosphatase